MNDEHGQVRVSGALSDIFAEIVVERTLSLDAWNAPTRHDRGASIGRSKSQGVRLPSNVE